MKINVQTDEAESSVSEVGAGASRGPDAGPGMDCLDFSESDEKVEVIKKLPRRSPRLLKKTS